MPIQKATATTLKHIGGTYVVIPSTTIALIQDPHALAILVYLMDRPNDWIIYREHIKKRFSIGKDRYEKAMRELKALGLVWRQYERNDKGHITNTTLCIQAQTTVQPENPSDGKTERPETPSDGKTDHLNITESITQNISDVPAEQKAGPRRLPEDWFPSDKTLQRAVDLGYRFNNTGYVIREFKDYWITSGKRKKDWSRTFMNHLKITWERQQNGSNRYGKPKTASQILADDLDKTFTTRASP